MNGSYSSQKPEVWMVDLKYPVILENESGASGYSSESTLCLCGEQWVDEGKMRGAFIIDVEGRVFQIESVKKLGSKNILPRWLVPYSRRTVRVDYSLKYIEELNVEKLKERVKSLFRKRKNKSTGYGIGIEVKEASSILEVIEALGIE